MGIDARILLRVQGERPTDRQLTDWSWHLCEALGPEHFFIDRERGRRAIDFTGDYDQADEQGNVPRTGRTYHQDGDTLVADEGETFLEVSVWTRWYGIGYERGDILVLCAVAEWCEANIPGVSVWYGGDSSGVCAEPWPDEKRRELRAHLYSREGRDYFKDRRLPAIDAMFPEQRAEREAFKRVYPPGCALCPEGRPRWRRFGFGRGFAALSCAGCGVQTETRDAGTTWRELPARDKPDIGMLHATLDNLGVAQTEPDGKPLYFAERLGRLRAAVKERLTPEEQDLPAVHAFLDEIGAPRVLRRDQGPDATLTIVGRLKAMAAQRRRPS